MLRSALTHRTHTTTYLSSMLKSAQDTGEESLSGSLLPVVLYADPL